MEKALNFDEIMRLLRDVPWEELRARAEEATLREKGRRVFVRGLIEFSSRCRRNCLYCGLRAPNRRAGRYLLGREEILARARRAVALGADTIVLQSGEGAADAAWLAEVVDAVSGGLHVPVTLSVGECPASDYALWREAGARRYLLRHETSDPRLYAALHPGHTLRARISCLRALGRLGYRVGSGFMVGLPGQSLESIARDILLCRALRVGMAGVGPFIPHPDTPLAKEPAGSVPLALRAVAALRLALPWADLPATTALASLDPESGQTAGLRAGANVLMPSFTPAEASRSYAIYERKNRVSMRAAADAINAAGRLHALRV